MNCVELRQSLAEVEDGGSVQQRAHLRACHACSALVRDLNLIVTTAGQLRAADDPSPRVWNSIEIGGIRHRRDHRGLSYQPIRRRLAPHVDSQGQQQHRCRRYQPSRRSPALGEGRYWRTCSVQRADQPLLS